MDFQALTHLSSAILERAPGARVLVFGSTSVFASFPELASVVPPYKNTLDADFVPEPMSDERCHFLVDALGRESQFFLDHDYYADINSPRAFHNFPAGFRERPVPLPGVPKVFALEPNDMAVAKLIAGRPKDIALLSTLLAGGYLDEAASRTRLWCMDMDDKLKVKTGLALCATVAATKELGYSIDCPEQPWKT
jgi:hypothetical protein